MPRSCALFFVEEIPYIRVQLNSGEVVYALHPPPPIDAALAQIRHDYLQTVAVKMAQVQTALPYYTPTWLPLGLAIDHALSRDVPQIWA